MNLLFLIRDLFTKKPIPNNWKGIKISKTIKPTNERKLLQDFPVNSAQL